MAIVRSTCRNPFRATTRKKPNPTRPRAAKIGWTPTLRITQTNSSAPRTKAAPCAQATVRLACEGLVTECASEVSESARSSKCFSVVLKIYGSTSRTERTRTKHNVFRKGWQGETVWFVLSQTSQADDRKFIAAPPSSPGSVRLPPKLPVSEIFESHAWPKTLPACCRSEDIWSTPARSALHSGYR